MHDEPPKSIRKCFFKNTLFLLGPTQICMNPFFVEHPGKTQKRWQSIIAFFSFHKGPPNFRRRRPPYKMNASWKARQSVRPAGNLARNFVNTSHWLIFTLPKIVRHRNKVNYGNQKVLMNGAQFPAVTLGRGVAIMRNIPGNFVSASLTTSYSRWSDKTRASNFGVKFSSDNTVFWPGNSCIPWIYAQAFWTDLIVSLLSVPVFLCRKRTESVFEVNSSESICENNEHCCMYSVAHWSLAACTVMPIHHSLHVQWCPFITRNVMFLCLVYINAGTV